MIGQFLVAYDLRLYCRTGLRRFREKKQQNTKKFIEERKTIQIKQGCEKEKLKITHEKQVKDLDKDINI